jgi:hypothetical protein
MAQVVNGARPSLPLFDRVSVFSSPGRCGAYQPWREQNRKIGRLAIRAGSVLAVEHLINFVPVDGCVTLRFCLRLRKRINFRKADW